MNIIAKHFAVSEFWDYAHFVVSSARWKGRFIVLHNTGEPTLAQRPSGLTLEHIANLRHYYEGMGWHAGPHLFVDQSCIWGFSPLDAPGVHSPSWNQITYGVEQLGDFDTEQYDSGPGASVRANAIGAVAAISHAAGIDTGTMKLHKMDPLTTHKNCPGRNCSIEIDLLKSEAHDFIERHGA